MIPPAVEALEKEVETVLKMSTVMIDWSVDVSLMTVVISEVRSTDDAMGASTVEICCNGIDGWDIVSVERGILFTVVPMSVLDEDMEMLDEVVCSTELVELLVVLNVSVVVELKISVVSETD